MDRFSDPRHLRTALWLALLVLFFYLISYAGIPHSIDELATVSAAESLLHGTLQVNRMEWEQERYPPQNAPGTDGNLYSKKGLGSSLLAVPFLLVGKQWDAVGAVQLAFLSTALVSAATVLLFYHLAISLKASDSVALLAAIALGLGTMLWPYAKMLFGEPLTALGLTLTLLGLVRYSAGHRSAWLFIASLGLGMSALARSSNAIFAVPCTLFAAYELGSLWRQQHDWRPIGRAGTLFALPFGVVILAIALSNHVRFGTYLSHPLVPGEAFTTPLHVGLLGLLLSPGKGLFFYVPLAWTMVLSYIVDFRRMLRPPYLLALSLILVPLFFYGRWYDWPGGNAWGPRFLVPSMSAVVMLCLPALVWLTRPDGGSWRRWMLVTIIVLSIAAQLPGVLVNFVYQQNLDGIPFHDLVWQWRYSPLVSFWDDILSSAADPVWLHPFFWANPRWLLGLLGATSLSLVIVHARQGLLACRRALPLSRPHLLVLGLLTAILSISLVIASYPDVRWWEKTESFSTNHATRTWISDQARAHDVVVLDLREDYDRDWRVWEWINFSRLEPDYIGWLRKTRLTRAGQDRLRSWLSPYGRIWLVMQATAAGDPTSTTENWLRHWGYEGLTTWIETQRIVELFPPRAQGETITSGSVTWPAPTAVQLSYQIHQGHSPYHLLFDLSWQQAAPANLKFSVQVLDEQSKLLQQVDDTLAQGAGNRVGIYLKTAPANIVLKLYEPTTGQVYPVQLENGQSTESAMLVTIPR